MKMYPIAQQTRLYTWKDLTFYANALANLGGPCRAHATPYGTQFFHFCIHFHQKAPMSEVHAPPPGARPPAGNPGSATAICYNKRVKVAIVEIQAG